MSIKAMTAVWESRLESSKKFVLLYYADRGNDEGENIWPAVGSVARVTSLSKRTVQRLTREMVKDGLLLPDGFSKHGTNRYKIILDAVRDYVPKIEPEDEAEGQPQEAPVTLAPPDTVSPPPCHNDTPPLTLCHPSPDTMSPEPLLNHPLTTSLTTEDATASAGKKPEKKGDWLDCMIAFQKPAGQPDFSYFPEDCRPIAEEFFRLWQIAPPSKQNRSQLALWIKDCRSVSQACAEFGISLLERYFHRWEKEGKRLTISRPGSLVNLLYSEAGMTRIEARDNHQAQAYDPASVASFQAKLKASRQNT